MGNQLRRLGSLVFPACGLVLLSLLAACSTSGYATSREAAEAWTIGVVSDDVQMVGEAIGRDVTVEEVAAWREDLLGLTTTYDNVVPGLGLSHEDEGGASYFLESVTVDGETMHSDGAPLTGPFLFVARDGGWHVIHVEPVPGL